MVKLKIFILYLPSHLSHLMGFIFSKPDNGPSVNAHDRAVLNLKTQRDKLHKYTKAVCSFWCKSFFFFCIFSC